MGGERAREWGEKQWGIELYPSLFFMTENKEGRVSVRKSERLWWKLLKSGGEVFRFTLLFFLSAASRMRKRE